MNWGGFAGGFSQGVNNGMQIGKAFSDALKQKKIDDIRAEGIAEAQAARQAEINASVKDSQAKAAEDAGAPTVAGPKTGEAAPDTTDVQTQAVTAPAPAQPVPMEQPPVNSPQSAADAAPFAAKGIPSAPQTPQPAPPSQPQAQPIPSAAPVPEAAAVPEQPKPPAPAPIAATGIAGAPKRYTVNGKGFDDEASARKYAESQAPTLTEFMRKTMVPKMQEAYIAQGDPEKAAAWGRWASEQEHEEHAKTWAKTYQAAQAGDIDAAAAGVIKMYKNYDDGISLVSSEKVKDKDGNVTGFNVKLKTDATGETRSQFIDKKALTEMGLAALSPVQMFEQVYKRQQAADQMSAKAAIDAQNDARTLQRDVAKQGMIEDRADKRAEASDKRRAATSAAEHGYRLEEIATKEQLQQAGAAKEKRAEIQSNIDILKENGYGADEIKGMLPALLRAGEFKKATSPEEARRMIVTELAKDPLFNNKSREKQQEQIDGLMQLAGATSKAATAKMVPNPMQPPAAAAPAPSAPAAKPKGIPVFDSRTNSIVYK